MFAPLPHADGTSHVLPISTTRSSSRAFRKLVCPTSSPSSQCVKPMSTDAYHSSKSVRLSWPLIRMSVQMRSSCAISHSASSSRGSERDEPRALAFERYVKRQLPPSSYARRIRRATTILCTSSGPS